MAVRQGRGRVAQGRLFDMVVIMGRFPIEGQGKTRLAAELGTTAAHEIHQLLFNRAVETLGKYASGCLMALAEPLPPGAQIRWKVPTIFQRGKTLGDRMMHAAREAQALTGCEIVTLVGTDLPEISCDNVAWAEEAVRQGLDAAILPAKDGGFGLISMKNWKQEVWADDLPWGTAEVMERTREGLRSAGMTWVEGPAIADIDTAEDWQEFCQKQPTFVRYGSI